jgi:CheY-like chemotaxis protein
MTDRSRHTILVVDDHEATRYSLSKILRGAGFPVLEAATGAQALELAPSAAAIVLDVHLPDIDGFEVCRRVRAVDGLRSLPVVHVSSVHVTGFAQAKGQRAGADAYLLNPVGPEQLLPLLDGLLRRAA